jgi:hypothetical protein
LQHPDPTETTMKTRQRFAALAFIRENGFYNVWHLATP